MQQNSPFIHYTLEPIKLTALQKDIRRGETNTQVQDGPEKLDEYSKLILQP